MAQGKRRSRHRAPVEVRPGAEAARYLVQQRRGTRWLLLGALVGVVGIIAYLAAVPASAFAAVCLALAVLLILCALSQGVLVTVGYGSVVAAAVVLLGHRLGVRWTETGAASGTMMLLTLAAAGGARMWTVAYRVLAEQLRASNAALQRVNARLREANASLEQRVAERTNELAELSRRDELTGLYNRRHFMERLDEVSRACSGMCVLMVDADNFKAVNDTSGHAAGDRVLKLLATTMGRIVRSDDLLARIGGEEFAVLVSDGDEAGAELLAERLRAGVEAIVWPPDLVLPHGRVTVSVGFARSAGPQVTPTWLLHRADAALYASKRAGRNRVSRAPDAA